MAEILLPTAEKQDAIKKDTEEILSQFPISGGTDFSDSIPLYFYSGLSAGNPATVFEVNGKGVFGLALNSDSDRDLKVNVKITLDNTVVFNGDLEVPYPKNMTAVLGKVGEGQDSWILFGNNATSGGVRFLNIYGYPKIGFKSNLKIEVTTKTDNYNYINILGNLY